MKKSLILSLAAAAATLTIAPQAQAREGCGVGYHRFHGRCVMNRNMHRQVWVVGRYYNGRGYWDGHRWYKHREMHRGHWRYR